MVDIVAVFAFAADIRAVLAAEEHEQPDADQNQREELPEGAGDVADQTRNAEDDADADQPKGAGRGTPALARRHGPRQHRRGDHKHNAGPPPAGEE